MTVTTSGAVSQVLLESSQLASAKLGPPMLPLTRERVCATSLSLDFIDPQIVTPPGKESRLTRAMKAYHVEKARSPTDLPPWLFEEHERRPSPVSAPGRMDETRRNEERTDPTEPRSRGLRDIYDKAAATSSTAVKRPQPQLARAHSDETPAAPSKATNRLKALRDAKRSAYGSAVREEEEEAVPEPAIPEPRAKVRVGLPSGPRRF